MNRQGTPTNVLLTEPAQRRFRHRFFRWQCRIRQMAVRKGDARPTAGMMPTVRVSEGNDIGSRLTVLIVKNDPAVTKQFRYFFHKTLDPAQRYKSVVEYLSAAYFQEPESFADELTALCAAEHPLAEKLSQEGKCTLEFEQYSQSFYIPCSVRETKAGDALFDATFWHNSLFNASIPADVRVLVFEPRWGQAAADPAVI